MNSRLGLMMSKYDLLSFDPNRCRLDVAQIFKSTVTAIKALEITAEQLLPVTSQEL